MEALERVSAVQQVEKQLQSYILSDDIQVGDKLPSEKQLCESLSVGRGTIREAIRILQAKGFVEVHSGRGSFVASKSETNRENVGEWFRLNEMRLKDLTDVRIAIEPYATALAIKRVTDEEIRRLEAIHNSSIAAAISRDVESLAQCDEKFHGTIIEITRNQFFIEVNARIQRQLKLFRSKTFVIPQNVTNFIPAHGLILTAFERRDPYLGEKAMRAHMESVIADLESSKSF